MKGGRERGRAKKGKIDVERDTKASIEWPKYRYMEISRVARLNGW